ncbi:hypothetical protein V6N13_138387 [Hibiscus sabdariffa]
MQVTNRRQRRGGNFNNGNRVRADERYTSVPKSGHFDLLHMESEVNHNTIVDTSVTKDCATISVSGQVACTTMMEVRQENVQVLHPAVAAVLLQHAIRAKRVDGNRSKGVKILANKKMGGVKNIVLKEPSIIGTSKAMKAIGKNVVENVVVSLEMGVPGIQVSDPSSISMVSTKVASKDAVVVVPSILNPVNHTAIKVVPQVFSSTMM